jgi:hypothetical protein
MYKKIIYIRFTKWEVITNMALKTQSNQLPLLMSAFINITISMIISDRQALFFLDYARYNITFRKFPRLNE